MKFLNDQIKQYVRRTKDFCVYKVLHADDPPHRLALGIAIGFFVTFTPLIGFQMVVSVFLAWMLRANKLVGVPIVWISNPLTVIPIYYPCYWLGCKLLGMPAVFDEWKNIGEHWTELSFWWQNLMDFVGPLWLGCIIVATVTGVLTYYISLYAIRTYRLRRWGQLMPPKLTPSETIEDTQLAKKEPASGENAA